MSARDLEGALVALDVAIQTEKDGREFYERAAARTRDAGGRVLFTSLADDELEHLRLLESQRESLAGDGRWLPRAEMEGQPRPSVLEGVPIFSRQSVAEKVNEHTSDLSALRMALLLEKDSVAFYSKAALETEDHEGRSMYERLAEMEKEHQRILDEEYKALSKEFWHTMGFEPF
ncbi:MAG: ferritin family protein [Anaerolineae bacterium]|nr:ferritin family protein [Anaerolineae bacterium]